MKHSHILAGLFLAASVVSVSAQEAVPAGSMVVLGPGTLWRTSVEWKSPVVQAADGRIRLLKPRQYFWMSAEDPDARPPAEWRSAGPPEGWAAPDFDDVDWSQSAGPQGPACRAKDWQQPGFSMWDSGSPAEVNAVCSRAKFRVADPAKAGGLRLIVRYEGGVVLRVNGREIARGDLPAGGLSLDTLAAAYPDEAYLDADGTPLPGAPDKNTAPGQLARIQKRVRRLEAGVQADLLRAGVNVVSIEVHRSPYREVCLGPPHAYHGKTFRDWPWPWPHCRLVEARLTCGAAGEAVVPNAGRPAGLQVWRPDPWATVTGLDYGDPCEAVGALRLVGFRNGAFTAQLVVSSTEAFAGLSAAATDLAGAGRRIPSTAVLLRYPEPAGLRFDALLARPPAEVPPREYRRNRDAPLQRVAMQPLWVTVRVPADASPGEYKGTVRVEAEGMAAVEAPLVVQVHGWRLPDPAGLMAHNDLWQSHESVAARYRVPLWSERHFELMGECLELTAPLANKFCNIHLVKGAFCIGNTQSMIRWIDKGDGKYDYDFTVFDKCLDLQARTLGKPEVLMLDVCVPIHSKSRPKDGSNPIQVCRLNPATGKVEPMDQPPYAPATGVPFWKPILEQVKARLEKRGWWDITLLGTASDSGPTADEAKTFHEIWPEKGWLFSGHPRVASVAGGIAPVKCLECVWGVGRLWVPLAEGGAAAGLAYPAPWKSEVISMAFPRLGSGPCELYMRSDLRAYRLNPERALQCGEQGIGRVGIDFWPFTDAEGRTRQLDFGPGTGQFFFNTAVPWLLGAGPDGPVPTTRSEMFREGLQVREAMTFLQRAAGGGKLPAETVARIAGLLRQRAANMIREQGGGLRNWRQDEARLFALCAEAARAVAP